MEIKKNIYILLSVVANARKTRQCLDEMPNCAVRIRNIKMYEYVVKNFYELIFHVNIINIFQQLY